MSKKDVAVLVGSLRQASINLKLARAMQRVAPDNLNLEIVPIGDLPLYNQDLDAETAPVAWTSFRERIKSCDGVIFVTPEYNRSVPAVLKNAIEVGSRPYGKSVWDHKPGAITSASPGLIGGAVAALQLRVILTNINVPTLPQPEVYLSGADKLVGDNGEILNEGTQKFIETFLAAFEVWLARFK
ncbi:NAD(P)H-dependent oxidoreductase [Rhizobium sp. WYCCWR 11128]|uniref:NADPH-dependent FMN reductase n=1 Tax=Rhizobium sp. WYCCWR 11128 TaxID=2749832 RepID=UPI0015D2722A|nr:NAD(P)H-dependent oxidoreductase [Rhizobium sp. WYCCWR 11128]NYT35031.1 NAD(P)H-dependent oxidoreductase [Rhizobium sp. WYCCWR 11128]